MTNAPKKMGTAWERRVVEAAQDRGIPWDRAPLRGSRDLLDTTGCLPMGWLVGAKALRRTGAETNLGKRMDEGMKQANRALVNVGELAAQRGQDPDATLAGVVPVQVVQRAGYPVLQAYTVMEYRFFLDLVEMRRDWNWNPQ